MAQGTAADFARRHAEEIINGQRLDLVDELYAPDAVFNDPGAPGGVVRGRQEIKALLATAFQAMPDFHFSIEDNFGTADHGLWRGTVSATLRGDLGPSCHRKVRHLAHGRDLSDRGRADRRGLGLLDTLSISHQLGLIPTPGGT